MPRTPGLVSALLLGYILSAHAAAQDVSAAEVVRTFYTRLAGGDLAGAAALWTPGGRDEFERAHRRVAAVRCMRIERLEITESEGGIVAVTATLTEWNAYAARERIATRRSRFELDRQPDGWRIARWVEREKELAAAIGAARSAAERDRLLELHPELVGVQLGLALCKVALNAVNEQDLERAAAIDDLAERIARDAQDDRLLANVLGVRSVAVRRVPNPNVQEATNLAEESVRLAEASGDPDTLLAALLRLSRALQLLNGDIRREPIFERASTLTDEVEDLPLAALMETQIAWAYDDAGLLRKALLHSIRAEKLAEASGDLAARMSAQFNLGGTYMQRYDCALADPYNERALALAREAKFPGSIAGALLRQAHCRRSSGDPAGALRLLDEAIDIATANPGLSEEFEAFLIRAQILVERGDLVRAEADLERVMPAVESSHDAGARHTAQILMAQIRRLQGRYAEMFDLLSRSPDWLMARVTRIRALRDLGRFNEAETELRLIVESAERYRADVSADPRQIREFMSTYTPVSDMLLDLVLECGRVDDALQVLEERKASVLRDVIGGAGAGVLVLHPEERERLRDIEKRLVQLGRTIVRTGDAGARRELRATRLELADLWARVYVTRPELQWSSVPPALVDQLRPATNGITYISYAVMEEKTIVLTVADDDRGESRVRAVTVPIRRDELRKRVRTFVRQIATRDLGVGGNAQALYDLLLRPVERELTRHGRRVCIVPDDELWRLPFHALKSTRNTYVAEKASVFYAPSINVVAALMKRSRGATLRAPRLLALANPTLSGVGLASLPDTQSEVQQIARMYDAGRRRILTDGDATEPAFRSDAPVYDILHIAGHALLDDSAPMFSAVLLRDGDPDADGRLEAREIALMRLDARLAIVSACEAGLGEVDTGDGVVGLPWAFLAAGARSTVVSLWRVASHPTAKLMVNLHRELRRTDFRSVADALRAAQLALLHTEQYSHPYYWAPFVVVGAD